MNRRTFTKMVLLSPLAGVVPRLVWARPKVRSRATAKASLSVAVLKAEDCSVKVEVYSEGCLDGVFQLDHVGGGVYRRDIPLPAGQHWVIYDLKYQGTTVMRVPDRVESS